MGDKATTVLKVPVRVKKMFRSTYLHAKSDVTNCFIRLKNIQKFTLPLLKRLRLLSKDVTNVTCYCHEVGRWRIGRQGCVSQVSRFGAQRHDPACIWYVEGGRAPDIAHRVDHDS